MDWTTLLQILLAASGATTLVRWFDKLEHPEKGTKKDRTTAANSHAVGYQR